MKPDLMTNFDVIKNGGVVVVDLSIALAKAGAITRRAVVARQLGHRKTLCTTKGQTGMKHGWMDFMKFLLAIF